MKTRHSIFTKNKKTEAGAEGRIPDNPADGVAQIFEANTMPVSRKTSFCTRIVMSGLAAFVIIFFATRINYSSMIPDTDESFIRMFAEIMKLLSALATIAMIYAVLFVKIRPQKLLLISVLALGIIYIFILTPFSMSDEGYHYRSAMKLSNIINLQTDDKIVTDANYTDFHYLIPHENSPEAYLRMKDPVLTDQSESQKLTGRHHEVYLVQYIPQALGITLAKALHLNFFWLFVLGRLFNLIFFAICAYIAVKKMPFRKYLVVLIAIMPMTVQIAASFSYDTFINGLSILLVASIIESIYKKGSVALSEIIWIAAIAALLAPTKNVYCLLVFLVVFIPKERFSSMKSNLLSKALMVGAGFAAILLISLPSVSYVVDAHHATKAGGESFHFTDILRDPIGTVKLFFNTIKVQSSYWFFSMIGYRFGLHAPKLPLWIFTIYAALLALIPFTRDSAVKRSGSADRKNHEISKRDSCCEVIDEPNFYITLKMKIALFCIALGTFLLVVLSMYLYYTSADSTIIRGVQGRYLIPLLLPALLILKNRRFTITPKIIPWVLCASFVLHFIIFNYGLVVTLSGL